MNAHVNVLDVSRREAPGAPATRLRILEGAAKAFGRTGYAETTVDAIIAAAGVSRPSFYKFFRNKDEVFDLLHEMYALALIQAVKAAATSTSDPQGKLELATDAFLRQIATTGRLAQALYSESRKPGSRVAVRYRETVSVLTAFFGQQAAEMGIESLDPLVYGGLIAATEVIGMSLVHAAGPNGAQTERARRAILTILRGALQPLRARR